MLLPGRARPTAAPGRARARSWLLLLLPEPEAILAIPGRARLRRAAEAPERSQSPR